MLQMQGPKAHSCQKKDPTTMPVSSEKILLHFIRKLDIKWELTFAPLIPALFTLN